MMDVVAFEASPAFLHSVAVHLLVCVIMWLLVIAAIGTDLWDRVYTQKKLHKPLMSHRISQVADIDQLVRTIVTAASDHDAKQAIKQVAEYIGEDKNKVKE